MEKPKNCYFASGTADESDDSPASHWNVDQRTVKKQPSDLAKELYASQDKSVARRDYDSLIAQLRSESQSISPDYLSYSTSDTTSRLLSEMSQSQYNPSIMSQDRSRTKPSARQDHFTSSPKLRTNSRVVAPGEDDSQDVSLVSSIAAPFELRPKAYDDSVLTERNTTVGGSDLEEHSPHLQKRQRSLEVLNPEEYAVEEIQVPSTTGHVDSHNVPLRISRGKSETWQLGRGHKLHHSDGAAQLLALRRTHSDLTDQSLVFARLHSEPNTALQPRTRSQVKRDLDLKQQCQKRNSPCQHVLINE